MTDRVHYKELIDTNMIGQWDFKRDPTTGQRRRYTLEILSVERYKPERIRKKKDLATGKMVVEPIKRVLVRFKGARKPWLAGPVSLEAIARMFGPVVQDWVGKRVTLYVDEAVTFGRTRTGGVRCVPVPGQGAAEEMPEEPVDEELAQKIADAFVDEGGGV